MNHFYEKYLRSFLQHKWYVIPILLISTVLIIILWRIIPAEMAPLKTAQVTIKVQPLKELHLSLLEIIQIVFRDCRL